VDNTCRLAIGFVPDASKPVPGLCQTVKPQVKAGCTQTAATFNAPCP
jgi:hypothetical protein